MSLELERWDALDVKAQEASARVIGDTLLSRGLQLEFRALQPVAQQRRAAVYFDRKHGLEWVLVPGGRQRGWGARERGLIATARHSIEAWRTAVGEAIPPLESVRPYGGDGFSFTSMFGPDFELGPFLTTSMPLLGTTTGLPELDTERPRLFPLTGEPSVFTLSDNEVDPILQSCGWRLPTARQSQWLCGAGRFVFPWGDVLPSWLTDDREIDEEDFDEDQEGDGDVDPFSEHFRFQYGTPISDWSRANAFGIIDALVASHWVRDGDRLGWAGGAAECYPWQSCGEWAGFLTAAVVPHPPKVESWVGHALRPVIEL